MDSKLSAAIIGCGSVGSFTALTLGKMGIKVEEIYDADRIEEHNLPNQFYKKQQVGMPKTKALARILGEFTDSEKLFLRDFADGKTTYISNIIVSSVDTMAARKEIWKSIKKIERGHYIDSRMGGLHFTIFTICLSDGKAKERYEKTLIDDSELTPLRCTERTIIFNVLGLASFICNQVKMISKKEQYPFRIDFNYGDMSISHFK